MEKLEIAVPYRSGLNEPLQQCLGGLVVVALDC